MNAVVFDFDGLILDTEVPEYTSWSEAWADHGVELALDEWAPCIGTHGAFDAYGEFAAPPRRRGPRRREALRALTTGYRRKSRANAFAAPKR